MPASGRPSQSETAALFAALERGQWSDETRLVVAGQVKAAMQAARKWKERSEKKNPQKDHDHQDTLLVTKWLSGSWWRLRQRAQRYPNEPHLPSRTMHTVRIKTVIDPTHELHLSLPADTPSGDAEVIVMVHPADAAVNAAPLASLRAFFAELDARPQTRPRSQDEIEAQIAEERASWD